MHLEIAQREREPVVDANERGHVLGEPLDQPFRNALSGPVCAWGWRRVNLRQCYIEPGQIDAQALRLAVGVSAPE